VSIVRPPCEDVAVDVTGVPIARPADVGRVNWIDGPYNRWAFRNVRQLTRTAVIRRGGEMRTLPTSIRSLGPVEFDFDGRRTTVDEMLLGTYTDAFLVAVDGVLVTEQYFDGMDPAATHLLMSVSKSLTATAAGVLVGRGLMGTDDLVTDLVPPLAGTAWEGCTVQHLLDMRAGTEFDEDDYDDPDSAGRLIEEVSDYVPRTRADLPADTATWIHGLGNVREHGDRFQYRSILTDVLAWTIEGATASPFADVLSDTIWSRIGAEHDAEVIVDRSGFPLAEGGICCTARDLLRFGLMMLNGGEDVVPAAWVGRLRTHDPELVAAYADYADESEPNAFYRDMWWIADATAGRYQGSGINGQVLLIDHVAGAVIVKLSTWPSRWDDRLAAWTDAGLGAVLRAL
jgi:CubicO group peptidase (beta-lactamase class C family)